MKVRSGRAYDNMDTEPGTTREVANKLNQLYELGENLMTNPKNLDNVSKLAEVVVLDEISVAPSPVPESLILNRHTHLNGVTLPEIDGGSVTMLIGNDYAAAHLCLKSRFSPEPEESPDAILTPLGWLLRGPRLGDKVYLGEGNCNFLIRGLL